MPALLSVLTLSDAFSDFWPRIAASVGVERAPTSEAGGVRRDAAAVVVSAGGAEASAVAVLEQLAPVCTAPLLVVGAETCHRVAVSLLQAGAADYVALPGELGRLVAWLTERARERLLAGAPCDASRYRFDGIIGRSAGLRAALDRAARVIPHAGTTVLITGETGTGKDLLARCIHDDGPRAGGPFVEVNCAALPATLLEAELFGYERGAFTDARTAKPGLFEAADGGTLFLDEIGDLSPELQGKLLRVLEARRVRRLGSLQERAVDVRIIAATHVDLARAVEQGRFRRDLFYRLDVAAVHLPPLRARAGDVVLLAEHFVRGFSESHGAPVPLLDAEARAALQQHGWPGNVRELRNAVERALLFGDGRLRPEHLAGSAPATMPDGLTVPFPAPLRAIEAAAARAAVRHAYGNKSDAARTLGVSRKYLYGLLADAPSGEQPG